VSDEYSLQRFRGQLAIVWYAEGKRHRHSLGTSNRASAEAAARSIWQSRGGTVNTVGEAVSIYLSAKSDMLSVKRAEVAWKAAKSYWGTMPISRIDLETSVDYSKARPRCNAYTVRNELAVIRAALNHAEKNKLIAKAPFIQMPKLPDAKVRYLTKEQFRALVTAAHAPHVALFMKLAVGTGARSTALLELTWDRVNLERGVIDLNPSGRVQTSKFRATVAMNSQVKAFLTEAKDGAMSEYVIEYGSKKLASIKKGFEAATIRAKIKATPHMLRHSAAVWMAEDGVPMAVIAQFLGHSDSRITETTYARFSPKFLSNAAEALTW
jgi:integrase